MANEFIRVPADSTGKRIRHTRRVDIVVTTILIDLDSITDGDTVTGNTSSVTATFKGYSVLDGTTRIYVSDPSGTFTDGEVISYNAGTDIATISSTTDQYSQAMTITDPNIPKRALGIDEGGSAFVTYKDGDLLFDAFGNAQITQLTPVDVYMWLYGESDETNFYNLEVGGGVVTASAVTSQLELSVDTTSGSRAVKTTQKYYPYVPGEGNIALFTAVCGDSGKSGLYRRWGIFDDDDGCFFEQSGSTFNVVVRSSTGGTVTEARTTQADFNENTLLDANEDLYQLDLTKYQIYWIDFQWLGAGEVRFGVWSPEGDRIVLHRVPHVNQITQPYMKRGTLPMRAEVFNFTGTSGNSSLSLNCMATARQAGKAFFPGQQFIQHSSASVAVSSSAWVPLVTVRPKLTYNGVTNRTVLIPMDYEVYVDGDPIRVDTFLNASLTGDSYSITQGATEIDVDATSFTGGTQKSSVMLGAGVTRREIRDEDLTNSVGLTAQGTQVPITFAARSMKSGGNANVEFLIRWREVK